MRSTLLALLITLAACAPAARTTINYAYSNTADDIQTNPQRYKLLAAYLSKAVGVPVNVVPINGYGPAIEGMRAGKVDVATMGPLTYIIAAQKAAAEPIAIRGSSKGPATYQSSIIVRHDSPIQSIDDLIRDRARYTFAFVDPASTSGHIIPRTFLEGRGVDVEKDFRKMFFSSGHPTSLYTVIGGKVDAAATMPSMIHIMEGNGKIKPGQVRILWESAEIPASPVVVRKGLPEPIKQRLRQAYLDMAKADPTLTAALQLTSADPNYQYFPATDDMFDGLRKITRDLKNVKILE
jgi:phosphonate transport system substrate-binding protein